MLLTHKNLTLTVAFESVQQPMEQKTWLAQRLFQATCNKRTRFCWLFRTILFKRELYCQPNANEHLKTARSEIVISLILVNDNKWVGYINSVSSHHLGASPAYALIFVKPKNAAFLAIPPWRR